MKNVSIIIILFISLIYGQDKRIPNIDVKLISGESVKLETIINNGPLLISFWATWCAPCKKEMRYLDRFQKKYENLSILAISEDKTRSFARVKSFIKSNKYEFTIGLDPNGQSFKKLGAQVVPTSILIDSNRSILWQHQGYLPGDEKIMEIEIKKAIFNYDESLGNS
jgi:cytochrome c biogenesis protein CcmG/thiol:disulfide interchange protein DsbE